MNTTTTMNTTISTTTTTKDNSYWQHGKEEARIREVMVVSYWILLPLVVVVGVAVNALGLYLLHRPRMRGSPITAYMKLLLSLDVGVLILSLATIITLNGCHLHSRNEALYFAHSSFTLFYTLQIFSQYVIVWVCYDRFLALWYFRRFLQTQKPGVMRLRMLLTGVLCVLVNLRHLLDVEVACLGAAGQVEAANHTQDCEGGAWVILDSLHQRERTEAWQTVVWVLRGGLVIVMPVFLVLAFNLATVIGLVRRRLHSVASTTRTRDQAYSSIYISLAISFTSITTAMPTMVHAAFFAPNIKHCHGPFPEEVFRAIANFLLLGEHITHFLFLAINQIIRDELKLLFLATKSYLSNTLPCQSRQTRPTTFTAHISIKESPQVPHLVVSAPEKQPDGGSSVEVLAPTQASLSAFIKDAGLGGEQGTLKETQLCVSEPQHSARTSIMSLEDEHT